MIYCDMDGVLVDFVGAFFKLHGKKPKEIPAEEFWALVESTPDYWVKLPKMPDADDLLGHLSKYEFKILTGLPHLGYDKAHREKRAWIRKHYGRNIEIILCFACDKHNYCQCNKDVLIDDYEKNIKMWLEKGGVGILHTCANDTIGELKRIGYD